MLRVVEFDFKVLEDVEEWLFVLRVVARKYFVVVDDLVVL